MSQKYEKNNLPTNKDSQATSLAIDDLNARINRRSTQAGGIEDSTSVLSPPQVGHRGSFLPFPGTDPAETTDQDCIGNPAEQNCQCGGLVAPSGYAWEDFPSAPIDENLEKNAEINYPDLYAQSANGFSQEPDEVCLVTTVSTLFGERLEVPGCCQGFVRGTCGFGDHTFIKALLCGKEWCPDCGSYDSWSHRRRIARWWSSVMQMKKCGYMVVTLPMELREKFKDRKSLNKWRRYWEEKLVREGHKRGLIRYHWCGDDGKTWHPHLNIIVEANYIKPANLDRWKLDQGRWFNSQFGIDTSVKVNIHYQYCKNIGNRIHALKYITRATLRTYDPSLADLLYGIRNNNHWGQFEPGEKRKSELVSLEKGLCPYDGSPIKWKGFVSRSKILVYMNSIKPLGGGYFEVFENTS